MIRSPSSYLSSPPIIFKSVVLPEPDGPSMATNSFSLRLSDTPYEPDDFKIICAPRYEASERVVV